MFFSLNTAVIDSFGKKALFVTLPESLKKCPRRKISVRKNELFFLPRASIHQSFIFNSRFLYEL